MAEDQVEQPRLPEEVRVLQEERSRLTNLREHSGYKYLMEIAAAQIETRRQAVFLKPLKSMDETLEQEYLKGELSGITLFSQMVDIRVDELAGEITQLLEELEEIHERTGRRTEHAYSGE